MALLRACGRNPMSKVPVGTALLAALRGALQRAGGSGSVAGGAATTTLRGYAQDPGADHPHHQYADAHRAHEDGTTYIQVHMRRPNPLHAARQRAARVPDAPSSQALAQLGQQHGVADGKAFRAAVQKLPADRQHGLLENAPGVARHLQGLGLPVETVGRMLQHCPALFSFPAEERAEVLLAELMGAECGRSATEAAELFVRCPALANTRHVMPSVVRLVHHTTDS